MKNLEIVRTEYKKIQNEIEEIKLKYNYNKGFSREEDLDRFVNDNRDLLLKSNEIQKQIQEFEWELMTPEQQARRLEVSAKIKAKTGQNNNS